MYHHQYCFILIVLASILPNRFAIGYESSDLLKNSNLTFIDRSKLEILYENGCKNIHKVESNEIIEKKKEDRALNFAVIYSGQVCHGRGALLLSDPVQMNIYWKNKNKYIHKPLEQWGRVDIFGLFEQMVEGSIAIGGALSGTKEKADGCNDFLSLVEWTRIEFMTSEAYHLKGKVIQHGEQRRVEALYRFIGLSKWKEYDFIMQFRPDVMARKPITEWGINFNKVNYGHIEGSPTRCDPRKVVKLKPQMLPLTGAGDPFVLFPQKWTPLFMYFGSSVQGRSSIKMLGQDCKCCDMQFSKDINILDMNACHNTRSCLYHPIYYLYGERSCGEKDRPGEHLREFCNPGNMHQQHGLLNCGAAGMKTLRKMSKEEFEEFGNFQTKYYSVYDEPIKLDKCMVNSTTGFDCK